MAANLTMFALSAGTDIVLRVASAPASFADIVIHRRGRNSDIVMRQVDRPVSDYRRSGSARSWSPVSNALGTEPDVAQRYGRYTLNDYIGPHVDFQLYRMLNAMRWTIAGLTWRNRVDLTTGVLTEQNRRIVGPRGISGPDGGTEPTWAAVYSWMTSDKVGRWGANAAFDEQAPYAYSDTIFVRNALDTTSPSLYRIDRAYAYAHISHNNILARSFEIYLKAQTGGQIGLTPYDADTFDANGDNVANGLFKLQASIAATTDASVVSGQIGQRNPEPTFAPRPANDPGPTAGDETAAFVGWLTDEATVLVKSDVSGGLTYVD